MPIGTPHAILTAKFNSNPNRPNIMKSNRFNYPSNFGFGPGLSRLIQDAFEGLEDLGGIFANPIPIALKSKLPTGKMKAKMLLTIARKTAPATPPAAFPVKS